MKVPFVDFSQQYQEIKEEVDSGLKNVLQKGNFILGQEEKDFEATFAKYCSVTYGIGLNSGTDALHLAVRALEIGPGDEVILPTFTFIATALGVSYTGAKPVFVDIEKDTHNIDPAKIEAVITKKTKAIIPVHLYGQSASIEEILGIAKKHKIAVIEDAAQAHGATYQNKRIGSLGDCACFSFYPTKGLGACGDGGMVVTSNQKISERIQMLRDYGRIGRYEHVLKGYNSRLDTLQAVILNAKLKRLDEWNKMRQAHAAYYCELLKNIDAVELPIARKDRAHTYQTFVVAVNNRNKVCEKLNEKGVGVLIHYPIPLHLQKAYAELKYRIGDFPVSEAFADRTVSLPMFPHMTKDQIEYTAQNLKEIMKNG